MLSLFEVERRRPPPVLFVESSCPVCPKKNPKCWKPAVRALNITSKRARHGKKETPSRPLTRGSFLGHFRRGNVLPKQREFRRKQGKGHTDKSVVRDSPLEPPKCQLDAISDEPSVAKFGASPVFNRLKPVPKGDRQTDRAVGRAERDSRGSKHTFFDYF